MRDTGNQGVGGTLGPTAEGPPTDPRDSAGHVLGGGGVQTSSLAPTDLNAAYSRVHGPGWSLHTPGPLPPRGLCTRAPRA